MSEFTVWCNHDGCNEQSRRRNFTRRERRGHRDDYVRRHYNVYWCSRHSNMDTILSVENPRRVTELVSVEKFTDSSVSIGCYWGRDGFLHGPGFKTWCDDFPEGTKIRVTVEVILPSDDSA